MLVLKRECEGELDELMAGHCEAQKKDGIPASAVFLIGAELSDQDWVALLVLSPLPDIASYKDPVCIRPPLPPFKGRALEKGREMVMGKKALKPAGECIDGEWVVQQGKQILRSLPGGLTIKGLALLGEKKALRDLQTGMLKALRAIHKASIRMNWSHNLHLASRMYLVNMESPRGSPSGTQLEPETGATSTCRVGYQPQKWASLRAHFLLPQRTFYVEEESNFQKMFIHAFAPVSRRIKDAVPLFNGQIKDLDEAMVGKTSKKSRGADDEDLAFTVDLLLSLDESGEKAEGVDGSVRLSQSGSMEIYAMVPSRATWAQAADAVKEDILRSLYTRLDLHFEEMEVVEEGEDAAGMGDLLHEFPRRVVLSESAAELIGLPVPLTDYIFKGDDIADIVENLATLFNLPDLTPDHVLPTEETVPDLSILETPSMLHLTQSAPTLQSHTQSNSTLFYLGLGSLLAVLVGVFLYLLLGSQS